MQSPKTLAQKIWDRHVVHSTPDGPDLLYIDLHLLHEVTSPQAFEGLKLAGRKPWRVSSIVATAYTLLEGWSSEVMLNVTNEGWFGPYSTKMSAARQERGWHGGQRHHQVEGDQDPTDGGDAGVQLAVDLRQRQDDDRGVGQDQADGERQCRDPRSRCLAHR